VFREFAVLCPHTVVLTSVWPGFIKGYEGTFSVRCLPGFKFITLSKKLGGTDRGFLWLPLSMLRALWIFRPDVVFVSGFSLWTLYALLFRAFGRCRVIVVWDGFSPNVAYLDSPVRTGIRRVMARYVDGGVSNMRAGVEYLRDVLGMSASVLVQHPYQVPDTAALCAGEQECRVGKVVSPIFLVVGRLIPSKGLSAVIEAAALLVQRGLESFSIVIVGSGAQAEELRGRIASHGLEKNFHEVGQVAYEDMGAYFRAADVFVFPTLEDVWGVVLLEAMAFGKAVLCSKFAGASEIVQPGVNGFIFDPGNPLELADYMTLFIRDPSLIVGLGARARETIVPYTPARAASVLASMVDRLSNPQ
jgi:glycosyltransferase involved in cell wall biosynthesis